MNHPKELIEDIRNGKMVILVDDEDRENEGDLVMAADFVTPEAINFMISKARGLVCLALTKAQVEKLNLYQMIPVEQNRTQNKTAFTVSIEAAKGISTGISAADRAHTVRVASHPNAVASDVSMPGHIFPIKAQDGGVLKRAGHTEGSVDLAKLAGLNPAAVICEIINLDGTMARVPDLKVFAKENNLKIGTIVDLIQYRLQTEIFVNEVASNKTVDKFGDEIEVKVFRDDMTCEEHLVVIKGQLDSSKPTYVRVHAQNFLDDLIGGPSQGSKKLDQCLQFFNDNCPGVIVYIQKSQELSDLVSNIGYKPIMDQKNIGIGSQILKQLGLSQIRIISDSEVHSTAIKAYNLEITDVVSFKELAQGQTQAESRINL